jgi:hypothetical protein
MAARRGVTTGGSSVRVTETGGRARPVAAIAERRVTVPRVTGPALAIGGPVPLVTVPVLVIGRGGILGPVVGIGRGRATVRVGIGDRVRPVTVRVSVIGGLVPLVTVRVLVIGRGGILGRDTAAGIGGPGRLVRMVGVAGSSRIGTGGARRGVVRAAPAVTVTTGPLGRSRRIGSCGAEPRRAFSRRTTSIRASWTRRFVANCGRCRRTPPTSSPVTSWRPGG